MKRDTPANEYICSVSSAIICSPKKKKAFLNQLREDVEAFLDENSDATVKDIEGIFGSPEGIAASFISNSDSDELKRKLSLKKLVFVAVSIALLIYLAFVVISLVDVHNEAHGYFEEALLCVSDGIMKGWLK